MDGWSSTVKVSTGIMLFLSILAIVMWIFSITHATGGVQMRTLEEVTKFGEWDDYDGKVVDRPSVKNIARANKERVIIFLGGTRLSDDSQVAHNQINAFTNNSTPVTRMITMGIDANRNITMTFN